MRDTVPEHAAPDATPSSTPEAPAVLTASQLHALFDILTHHETYAEVERFKEPATISEYGYPFGRNTPERNGVPSYAPESSAPLLAGVFRSIVLQFPGLRDLPPEFWYVRFQGIMEKLAEAELSESCDKGAVGTRKTLATAASAIHEVVSRGILGGVEDDANRNLQRAYNRSKAEDLVRAWEDSVHELVYGNLVEELFACAAEKQSLEEHSPGVQAAADYIIIHLATLVHHVFVLSPEGPYLLKLLENVHKLLPYSMIKQTLRIGNAATMLQGIMRLLLAKVGVGAISNWVGLTQNADDGMNLLQRIISLVLSWDALEFRKSADAIEKAKGASSPSKDQLSAIRDHLRKPRHDHEDIRKESIQIPRSIIVTILERSDPALLHSLSEAQHAQCSEYFAALLEARDRDEISNVLCRQNPDLFTQAIKNVVASFEPMIRAVHERVDLREHVSAAESFITDLISLTKAKKSASGLLGSRSPSKGDTSELPAPSVEDYVLLLQNNRHLLYNWLHQVASQCPEIRDDFCAWAKETIKVFRQPNKPPPRPEPDQPTTSVDNAQRSGAAGSLSTPLQQLFTGLPPSTKQHILPAIDAHATYLSRLETLSLSRMQRILDNMEAITSATSAATATPTASTSYLSASYWSGRSYPRSTTLSPPLSPDGKPRPKSYSGPGMYLFRWQQLLDSTIIGPASLQAGSLRTGRDVKGVLTRGKIGSGGVGGKEGWDSGFLRRIIEEEEKEAGVETAVDVSCVVEALGEGFRKLVGGLVKSSPPGGEPLFRLGELGKVDKK